MRLVAIALLGTALAGCGGHGGRADRPPSVAVPRAPGSEPTGQTSVHAESASERLFDAINRNGQVWRYTIESESSDREEITPAQARAGATWARESDQTTCRVKELSPMGGALLAQVDYKRSDPVTCRVANAGEVGRTDESSDEVAGGSGFFVTYEVVADTPEDALALAARHEPEPLRAGLQLDECEALEPRPNEPHGVYWASGRVLRYCGADLPAHLIPRTTPPAPWAGEDLPAIGERASLLHVASVDAR